MNRYILERGIFSLSKLINHTIPKSYIAESYFKAQNRRVRKLISRYEPNNPMALVNATENTKFPIWVFWGTGFDDAPEVVRVCRQQMEEVLFGEDLRFLDFTNLHKYIKLPETITRKYSEGRITLTHLSDIIRMALLSEYGGIWIDATVLILGKTFLRKAKQSFFTVSRNKTTSFNVATSRWTGFFIGGADFRSTATFAYHYFLQYWEDNDYLVNYFLIDYVLDAAWRENIGNFKYLISVNEISNSQMFSLVSSLGNKEMESAIIDGDSELFKLTYKSEISMDYLNNFIHRYKSKNNCVGS